MIIIRFRIPVSVLEYFEDFEGYLLTGFTLVVEVDNVDAYQKIKKEFSDKLLVPSSANVKDTKDKYFIEYGPFKIEAPKDKVVLLSISNFEVEEFAKYLKSKYKLEYCSVKKEIELLEIEGFEKSEFYKKCFSTLEKT